MTNKVIIAAAGAGKTQYIVTSSNNCEGQVLITSYTIENTEEIKARFYKLYGKIPSNIMILPWFTFLLRFIIKPFQNIFIPQKIEGIHMENGNHPKFLKKDTLRYYLDKENRIYSGKVGSLSLKFVEDFNFFPLENLFRIFQHIYIDEMQDMGGYDLEFVGLLLKSKLHAEGVCDPRQATYSSSDDSKNKNIKGINIEKFLKKNKIPTDNKTLNINHRCHIDMVNLSNSLYPDFLPAKSDAILTGDHLGVYVVRPKDITEYLYEYGTEVQELRFSKTQTNRYPSFKGKNIGDTKGRTFSRTLLYLPSSHTNWLFGISDAPEGKSKAILYVGLTRARFCTAIVFNYNDDFSHPIIKKYK